MDLVYSYQREFDIDVSPEFSSAPKSILLKKCKRCNLEHFEPSFTGSSEFYRQVASIPGYYSENRWEFDFVSEALNENDSLIDVGCGDGVFLQKVSSKEKYGIELSEAAIDKARSKGLDVRNGTLADCETESADIITLFQVLEHVSNPQEILENAYRVLRRGGKLYVAVPNNEAFIGWLLHFALNGPPHHVLRWSREPLEQLGKRLGFSNVQIQYEPLIAEHHFSYHKGTWIKRLTELFRIKRGYYALSPASVKLRKVATLLTFISIRLPDSAIGKANGHTILAIYNKA